MKCKAYVLEKTRKVSSVFFFLISPKNSIKLKVLVFFFFFFFFFFSKVSKKVNERESMQFESNHYACGTYNRIYFHECSCMLTFSFTVHCNIYANK